MSKNVLLAPPFWGQNLWLSACKQDTSQGPKSPAHEMLRKSLTEQLGWPGVLNPPVFQG